MSIRFAPHDGLPVLFETSSSPEPMPPMRKCPSGWWILPAIIVGFAELIAIIGWLAS